MTQPDSEKPLSDAEARNIRLLKGVVTVLGLLIVAAVVILVGTIVMRASDLGDSEAAGTIPVAVDLPPNAQIESFQTGDRQLVVELKFAGDPYRKEILIFDLATGRQIARIAAPQP